MENDEKGPVTPDQCVRIFLVEDNPDHVFIALTVMRQVLGDSIEMLHAQSAEEALEMIPRFTEFDRPDLFFVDLRLPDNGGFSVLAAVRGSEVCGSIPVFVITSSMYDRDIAQSYELGASAVLSKPLSRAKLREELARIGAIRPGSTPTTTYRH
ncbi:MAG: response regulator [Candidatus Binataceae bacterium]